MASYEAVVTLEASAEAVAGIDAAKKRKVKVASKTEWVNADFMKAPEKEGKKVS